MEFAIDLLNADQIDAILSVYASVADWLGAVINNTSSVVIEDIPM
ncbi:hypothetical protein [Neolewinella agarilytica]|uniref:Uncharacterized protein n=1 Tax=Neolewinella agarilytica TaxID=478744 RepID=A0A1H9INF0_9BACT|nr:hypothetical protein [Neolewinella agarilytica]SEQ75905.1 hypothetical protein SAMN05444359_11566 [Neolewinella agarilytica]